MIESIAAQIGLQITGQVDLPARQPRYAQPPDNLHPLVKEFLNAKFPQGLYSHQALAISAVLNGQDVCLSTSTASGKSAVFISAAGDFLKRDPHARVIAFYPVRALVQDQLEKWKEALSRLGVTAGFIDGSVPVAERPDILLKHRVILMTPDVAHAWFMSSLAEDRVALVRENLSLIILDEAHVYDGVFGTNMAFFLRRFQAACRPARMICSTATLGKPDDFILQLTGRKAVQIGSDQEGAAVPEKSVYVAAVDGKKSFDLSSKLLKALAKADNGRFIAFADSRKMVELLTAAAHRSERDGSSDNAEEALDETSNHLLPYRAGYENDDRVRIQAALSAGQLRGVVSTSALELGLDIGEVNAVILLTSPPTMKAFWQRVGRAGRKHRGECLILDTDGLMSTSEELKAYINRAMEPNWLYLPNRYIQYAHALCAAQEKQEAGTCYDQGQFASLPENFTHLVEEEINPTQMLAPDLFNLKQRSQGPGPHMEFPLRSGVEPNYKVQSQQQSLGEINFSQLLREGYPGAVYYYMARPFRINMVNSRRREVSAFPEARYTTTPINQAMVFPDFGNGIHRLLLGTTGFVAEAELQVGERVTGFKEKRGPNESVHNYQAGSPFAQRPLQRLIRTTGVCWYFQDDLLLSEAIASCLMETFCREFGVQPRDVGIGRFFSRQSPLGSGQIQGMCIFDVTNGSLRLTERLGEQFSQIVSKALSSACADSPDSAGNPIANGLRRLYEESVTLKLTNHNAAAQVPTVQMTWLEVIAPNTKAYLITDSEVVEVTTMKYFFGPQGLKYRLKHESENVNWAVDGNFVQPIPGITTTVLYNPETGEEKAVC